MRGQSVCRETCLLAYNINKETFRRVHHKFKDGVLAFEHHNKGKNTVMPKTADQSAFLGSRFWAFTKFYGGGVVQRVAK